MSKGRLGEALLRAAPYGTLKAAARETAVRALATARAVACEAQEIQEAADNFRLQHGLVGEKDTIRWLTGRGWSVATWQTALETSLLEAELAADAATGAAARERFERSPQRYAKANVGVLVVEDEGIAREIHLLLTEEGLSFDVLAQRYSIEFASGGRPHPVSRRPVWRAEAPPQLDRFFAAPTRGPVDVPIFEAGGYWHLIRIYHVEEPRLDDATEALLRSICLEEALQPYFLAAFGDLLDEAGCPRPADPAALAGAVSEIGFPDAAGGGLVRRAAGFLGAEPRKTP